MKKTIALILALTLSLFAFVSCAGTDADTSPLKVGYLAGPTGMGRAKLINDTPEDSAQYEFAAYTDPNLATPDLLSGTIDMACLPTNAAANLFNKGKDISVLAVNTLGSLFVIADKTANIETISDLEGKTIHLSVPGSTTEPILKYILEQNNIKAEVLIDSATHDDLVAKVKASEGSVIAVLPEPKVSATLAQAKNYEVKLNLSKEWDKISDEPLAMGCIVVRNDVLENKKNAIKAFLSDYKNSVQYIANAENKANAAQIMVDLGIIPKLPIATSALTNLDGAIVLITGQEMTQTLKKFYDVLLDSSPASIGEKQPADSFYYE